jgi:hypothetical protein
MADAPIFVAFPGMGGSEVQSPRSEVQGRRSASREPSRGATEELKPCPRKIKHLGAIWCPVPFYDTLEKWFQDVIIPVRFRRIQ